MKVWNLRCENGHGFEGWFASEDDYAQQQARQLLTCPLCDSARIERLPSAPRLNLAGHRAVPPESPAVTAPAVAPVAAGAAAEASSAGLQKAWLQAVRTVLSQTEDVGHRFPEEARRMHHGEIEPRGIRGQATPEERAELREEGIEVFSLPVPEALKGPSH